jgi:hypothetical protein
MKPLTLNIQFRFILFINIYVHVNQKLGWKKIVHYDQVQQAILHDF